MTSLFSLFRKDQKPMVTPTNGNFFSLKMSDQPFDEIFWHNSFIKIDDGDLSEKWLSKITKVLQSQRAYFGTFPAAAGLSKMNQRKRGTSKKCVFQCVIQEWYFLFTFKIDTLMSNTKWAWQVMMKRPWRGLNFWHHTKFWAPEFTWFFVRKKCAKIDSASKVSAGPSKLLILWHCYFL